MGYASLAKVPAQSVGKIDLSIKAQAAPGVFGSTIVVMTRPKTGEKLAAVAKNVRQQQESQLSVTTTELDAGPIDAAPSAAFTFDRASTKGQTFTVIEILVLHADNLYIVTANSLAASAAQMQAVLVEVLGTWHWT